MEEELTKKNRHREVLITLLISFLFMGVGFFLTYQTDPLNLSTQNEKKEREAVAEQARISGLKQNFFGHLKLEAKAYIIYNSETGEIVAGRNEKKILPLASLTKVMTVLATSEQIGPNTNITIGNNIDENATTLRKGERWQMANLAALTLVSSSNEGAEALAEAAATSSAALVEIMNQKAKSLNLNSFHFINPTGLDENYLPGGVGTALDVAKLFSYVLKNKPELLSATKESSVSEQDSSGLTHNVLNTNTAVNEIPGLFAGKTGYTDLAGGNLAVAANIGLHRPLIFVVLGSSKEGRFSDTKKLTEATFKYYAQINK